MKHGAIALLLVACSGNDGAQSASREACVQYGFTRLLPGSGTDASVAADGSIVVVSEVAGEQAASVLDQRGTLLSTFALGPFAALVRAGARGEVVAAAADGRIRRFAADGTVRWSVQLEGTVHDLLALDEGGAIVATQVDGGRVSRVDAEGRIDREVSVRTAPFLALDEAGALAMTSRDACRAEAPCGAGFDPARAPAPNVMAPGGNETSAVVLLDPRGATSGGFVSNIDPGAPAGPLFIRAGLTATGPVVLAKAMAAVRTEAEVDVDPGVGVALRKVDTEVAPDHLLGFSGRALAWDFGFEPLDDSGRAYVVGLFANRHGVVLDLNGDVYKTHHILQLSPDGQLRLRYDKPNDGSANDVRLAGMDAAGHIVLSGRFEGTQDFDPGDASDLLSATPEARRYVTVISACSP